MISTNGNNIYHRFSRIINSVPAEENLSPGEEGADDKKIMAGQKQGMPSRLAPFPLSATAHSYHPLANTEHILPSASGGSSGSQSGADPLQAQAHTIFGSDTTTLPDAKLALQERERRADNYGTRVFTRMMNIENGSEAQRNVNFLKARPFMTPYGFFSAGLMAAGVDPQEKITVKFTTAVGMGGVAEQETGAQERSYRAWEIAAGKLDHDKPGNGGIVNFSFMHIRPEDQSKVDDLKAVGGIMRKDWDTDVMRLVKEGSDEFSHRSGQADAFNVKASLQSLLDNKAGFEKLSPEAQQAVQRTLRENGQVIIPNLYGYPMSGFAFIPNQPYDGNPENRPNQGLMINLQQGRVDEIHGDNSFAKWAGKHRDELQQSFNASDRQGGMDAHWPQAGRVLDELIAGSTVTLPERSGLFTEKAIPVNEVFNYTESRGSDYELKYGRLTSTGGDEGIASKYKEMNKKNAIWDDQTAVFGDSQQNWKNAKEIWNNSFGYLPVLGNAGNIAFGVHDGIYGMTAEDRIGGNAGAVISGLQLASEVASSVVGEPEPAIKLNYGWKQNPETGQLRFVQLAKEPEPVVTPEESNPAVAPEKPNPVITSESEIRGSYSELGPILKSEARPEPVTFNGKEYYVAKQPDAGVYAKDGYYLLRIEDKSDPSRLRSSAIIARPDENGTWQRLGSIGGNNDRAAVNRNDPLFRGVRGGLAEINGYSSSVEFDIDKNSWRIKGSKMYVRFNEQTKEMERIDIPGPATNEQRARAAAAFNVDKWPALPELSSVEDAPGAVDMPKNIEQIWIGSSEGLIKQKNIINNNVRKAKGSEYSFNINVLPEGEGTIARLKQAFSSDKINIIDMNDSPEFQSFKKTKYYDVFRQISSGEDANRAAASDIYRYWLINKKGGFYLDTDDGIKPAFFKAEHRVERNNFIPSNIVSNETLSMNAEVNSNFFGAHAGSQVLTDILEKGYHNWSENPEMYQNRPRILEGQSVTSEQQERMNRYMTGVSNTWGPRTLTDVFFNRNPEYVRFRDTLNSIISSKGKGAFSSEWDNWSTTYGKKMFATSNTIKMGSNHSWHHSR